MIITGRERCGTPTLCCATSTRTGSMSARDHCSTRCASITGHRATQRRPQPLRPFRAGGRMAYNPRLPKQQPRALSDERWTDLFAALRSNRDRALLSLTISSAARSGEILGLRGVDVDWGEQLYGFAVKGQRAAQWLPASPEAFVWLRLYLDDLATPLGSNDPVWWTLRRRDHGDGLARQPVELRSAARGIPARQRSSWAPTGRCTTCGIRPRYA